jgi:hypothetical protein
VQNHKTFLSCVYIGDVKRDVACENANNDDNHCTCHVHLGQRNTDRIVSIYVATPKVAKASKEGDIALRNRGRFCLQILPM